VGTLSEDVDMPADSETKIKVQVERAESYRVVPAAGAYGVVTPQGDVYFDLYTERQRPPKEITITIKPGEGAVKEQRGHGRSPKVMVREHQVGCVLRADIAIAVGEWLVAKGKEAIAIRAAANEAESSDE